MILWVMQEQKRLNEVVEQDNIKRLQKKISDAKAELKEAQLRRQNRVMSS